MDHEDDGRKKVERRQHDGEPELSEHEELDHEEGVEHLTEQQEQEADHHHVAPERGPLGLVRKNFTWIKKILDRWPTAATLRVIRIKDDDNVWPKPRSALFNFKENFKGNFMEKFYLASLFSRYI